MQFIQNLKLSRWVLLNQKLGAKEEHNISAWDGKHFFIDITVEDFQARSYLKLSGN